MVTFYRRIADAVDRLKRLPDPWWVRKDWQQQFDIHVPQVTQVDRKQVVGLLDNVLDMVRQYLHLFVMECGYRAGGAEEFWRTAVMVQAAKVIELAHGYDQLDPDSQERYPPRVLARRRLDWVAVRLYASRGKAAHTGGSVPSDLQLRCFLALLLAWLSVRPVPCSPPPYRDSVPVRELLLQNQDLQTEYSALLGDANVDLL